MGVAQLFRKTHHGRSICHAAKMIAVAADKAATCGSRMDRTSRSKVQHALAGPSNLTQIHWLWLQKNVPKKTIGKGRNDQNLRSLGAIYLLSQTPMARDMSGDQRG